MSLPIWVKLRFGPYHPQRFRVGDWVLDLRRGQVIIAGLTNSPIQWPFYRTPGALSPLLY